MAAEGKIHSRMATADANVLAGASNGQDTKSEIQESVEPEGNRGEELDGKILKEGDSEELVAIQVERTLDEL